MRLPGVLAALGVLVLVPADRTAADPLGTASPLVAVGPRRVRELAAAGFDALPATWTTGSEWDDSPLSAYGAGA